tara:strand:+ start:1742 stop:2830 length:1089 start_codon:yes stop_codon:yes gene_type:complete
MGMQQVEYEFPNPDVDETLQEVEIPKQEPETPPLEIEEAVGRETIGKPSKKQEVEKTIKAGDVEIEVENDVPVEDRDREPVETPEDLTDDELKSYEKKSIRKRIQNFSKSYHDERRAKEEAWREREAMERYAKQLVEENQQLKSRTDQSHNALIESAKRQVQSELAFATQQYKKAYDSGETDAIVEAQQALNTAQIRADKVSGLKPKEIEQSKEALQPQENNVQSQELAAQPAAELPRDEVAEAWADKNTWFGNGPEGDPVMSGTAWGIHTMLGNEGVVAGSEEYYSRIDALMREIYPKKFSDEIDESSKAKPSNVVAPATRSTSPNKIRLKQSEIAVAKRLGVSLEEYAKQVAKLVREQNA